MAATGPISEGHMQGDWQFVIGSQRAADTPLRVRVGWHVRVILSAQHSL